MCKPTVEPYWKCLLAEVSRQDPTPIALQRFYLIFTVAAYLPVIFPMSFAVHFLGFKESHLSFDETILPPNDPDAPSFTQFISNFVTATSLLTGLSSVSLSLCAVATFTFYALLVSMDLNTRQRPYPWPKSWKTNNNICYQEMFAEPSRQDRMIRRPGNTLSNVFYLFSALVVLTSAFLRGDKDNAALPRIPGLIISDAIFGGMLLILSIASTAWHGCNAAWSHIADLWSMEVRL